VSRSTTPVTIIVCGCGKRLNARGAVPGRVGRCPACGASFQVPATPAAAEPAPAEIEVLPQRAGAPPGTSAYAPSMDRREGSSRRAPTRDGLIRAPERLETRLRDSLLYPFWGSTGLALLGFMPPVFWVLSLPTFSVIATLLAEGLTASSRLGVVFLLPFAGGFAVVLGFTLLYLGRVLVASALGEIRHPRWPDWELREILQGVTRWFWAAMVGVVIGVVPAMAYWIACGDVDALDVVVLVELLAVGAIYAQMALLASILHDDPLGANPVTVVLGVYRMGWSYARPCLVSAVAVLIGLGALGGLFAIANPLLAALAFWAFWVLVLYLAMVALRVLGLCYHGRSRSLGWFRERPRWGA
jgi:hypothetical protein